MKPYTWQCNSVSQRPVFSVLHSGAKARRGTTLYAGNSFFGGLSKVFGRQQEDVKSEPVVEQRSTVDRILTGDGSTPVFPPYTVIKKTPEYTLRLYDVFPVVEMPYQRREEGYAALGGYIDGRNSQTTRFTYSQPVVMCYETDGSKVMQMYLGPRRDGSSTSDGSPAPPPSATSVFQSLPAPSDPGVRINVAGGEVAAVRQFEGYITPANAEAVRQRLISCLQRDGIRLAAAEAGGRFRCAQYGAVYQLGERLNEVVLRVEL